jgi:hypothetical protein
MKRVMFILILSLFFSFQSYSQTLQIFGGQKQNIYLGCLNCSNIEKESIWNEKGNYGNNNFSKSIWNSTGIYGSPQSNYSPWNRNAKYPPALKDTNGEFYGLLSTNEVNGYRAEFELAKKLYESHTMIKNDVNGWYYKIFGQSVVENK